MCPLINPPVSYLLCKHFFSHIRIHFNPVVLVLVAHQSPRKSFLTIPPPLYTIKLGGTKFLWKVFRNFFHLFKGKSQLRGFQRSFPLRNKSQRKPSKFVFDKSSWSWYSYCLPINPIVQILVLRAHMFLLSRLFFLPWTKKKILSFSFEILNNK